MSLPPPLGADSVRSSDRLPLAGLLALATAGFITILTEALPAGLLPQMGQSLNVSESLVGQLVTLYAVGSLVAAVPLTALTRRWRRRPLLLTAIGGFALANTVTASSTSYPLTLGARALAGIFAGLLWALLAGYAGRMVPERARGKAIAVAMVGTPLALSLGIPSGTFLGAMLGWRTTFGVMSVLSVVLVGWVVWQVPDFPGQPAERGESPMRVLRMRGVKSVLLVTLAFVLAHNVLYTYVSSFLALAGMAGSVDVVLLAFGMAALVGIGVVGAYIDRRPRALVLLATALFAAAMLALGLLGQEALVIYSAVAAWGLAFGGAATLFQTASAHAAGASADLAQSMIVTVWNLAIAGGALLGAFMLDALGAATLPWASLVLLGIAGLVTRRAREHGFPAGGTR